MLKEKEKAENKILKEKQRECNQKKMENELYSISVFNEAFANGKKNVTQIFKPFFPKLCGPKNL